VSRQLSPGEILVCRIVGASLLALLLACLLVQLIESVSRSSKFAGKLQEQTHFSQPGSSRAKDPSKQAVLTAQPSERSPDGPLPHNSTAVGARETKLLADALKATARSAQDGKSLERNHPVTEEIWTETFQPILLEKIVMGKFASAESDSSTIVPEANSATLHGTVSTPEDDLGQVQARLRDLGFLSSVRHPWDASSRKALRDFKLTNGLPNDDVLDMATREKLNSPGALRADQSFFGNWCRSVDEKGLRLSITSRGTKSSAGSTCVFDKLHAENGSWRVRATCSTAKEKWTANGLIKVTANKLAWASDGDVVNYSRCN
jgi:hypothetical protein